MQKENPTKLRWNTSKFRLHTLNLRIPFLVSTLEKFLKDWKSNESLRHPSVHLNLDEKYLNMAFYQYAKKQLNWDEVHLKCSLCETPFKANNVRQQLALFYSIFISLNIENTWKRRSIMLVSLICILPWILWIPWKFGWNWFPNFGGVCPWNV